jgi:hypothetical protein
MTLPGNNSIVLNYAALMKIVEAHLNDTTRSLEPDIRVLTAEFLMEKGCPVVRFVVTTDPHE